MRFGGGTRTPGAARRRSPTPPRPAEIANTTRPALALHSIGCVFCPDCPPARTARDLVLSETFWLDALFLALPFLIVLAAAVAIVRRLDRGSR